MLLNESQRITLKSFKLYRYLTARQLVQLGVYKTEKGLRDKILSKLKAQPHPLFLYSNSVRSLRYRESLLCG